MTFAPWLGNFNPTDQQRNEYIRLLKEALLNTSGILLYETGTYTGDGSDPKTISFNNTDMKAVAVFIVNNSRSDLLMTFQDFENSNGRTFCLDSATTITIRSGRIGSLDNAGSFTVSGTGTTTEGANINTDTYYWFAFGNL